MSTECGRAEAIRLLNFETLSRMFCIYPFVLLSRDIVFIGCCAISYAHHSFHTCT